MDAPDLITRAIRFTNTTRPNSADNRKAIAIVRELLQHINELEKEKARIDAAANLMSRKS